MRWQASWMLQNSDLETFAAVHACKRAKQATTQVLRKASSSIKQERSEWSDDRCCDWCHSLPASLSVRQKFEFSNQITTPAAHHCKTWLCAPSQLEDGQDSSSPPFFLIHGPIGLGSMMCKVLSRQRVFMKQLLGYCTRVTLRSSPREDDENLNLVNSCVGHAETALVSSPCTFLWDQQHCLLSKWLGGLWSIDLLNLAACLIFGICEQGLAQTQFFALTDSHQSETDTIYLASFGKRSFEEHLKWNRDDKLSQVLWKGTPTQKVVL